MPGHCEEADTGGIFLSEVSLERSTRLRRYLRKDYTQIVEFPVEIIGRDGQIRRYSYDDSVRLYQRRIRSAPMRYEDGELILAEANHCRQRIEQLRRSYLEHYGWGALRDGQIGGLYSGPLAAEVVSFLRRVFSSGREGPTSLTLSLVAMEGQDICYLTDRESGRTFLLYAFRLGGDDTAREAWRTQLRHFSSMPAAEGVERLFVVHEGVDIGLLLTGTGPWDGPVIGMAPEEGGIVAEGGASVEEPDAWAGGLRALHEGAIAESVRAFEFGMELHPLRTCFSQAAAVVALLDNQVERAEFAARHGRLLHVTDPLLGYLLGVALAREGRLADAESLVAEVAAARPGHALVGSLGALLAMRRGRFLAARAILVPADRPRIQEERFAARLHERVLREVRLGVGGASLAATGLAVGFAGLVVAALGGESFAWAPLLVVAAGLAPAGGALVARQAALARGALSGRVLPDLRLVSIDLLPRDSEGGH